MKPIIIITLAVILTACGGGGGDGTQPPPQTEIETKMAPPVSYISPNPITTTTSNGVTTIGNQ